MAKDRTEDESVSRNAAQFATTHWSVVLAAGDSASPDSQEALDKLCRTYWYPLYAYVRRLGKSTEDAKDLTQGFFCQVLAKSYFKQASRARGRFRSFLLTAFKHYASDEYARSQTQKRGGGLTMSSWEEGEFEERLRMDSVSEASPENSYDRAWAHSLMQAAYDDLETEMQLQSKGALFEGLRRFLSDPGDQEAYRHAGQRMGMSSASVRTAVWRLRSHYRELIRRRVANTVSSIAEIDDEMRYLLELLGA